MPEPEREIDKWINTTTWKLAIELHALLCRDGHQMDQCWGLVMPYDLKQPRMSRIQRDYLTLAWNIEQDSHPDGTIYVSTLFDILNRKAILRTLPAGGPTDA